LKVEATDRAVEGGTDEMGKSSDGEGTMEDSDAEGLSGGF
jgi:hypothetical protein